MHTSKDPLHGVTLEALLTDLVARYGWDELARHIKINCFKSDPSIKSSLKFLRRTPWARKSGKLLSRFAGRAHRQTRRRWPVGQLAEEITLIRLPLVH